MSIVPAVQTLEKWLKARPLALSLAFALMIAWALCSHDVASEKAMPFGDGEHYVLRGMTLYGDLHSGQWQRFWAVFTAPQQSLAPLHYWIFFLLPQAWAGMTSFGAIQALATYGLLALGAWKMCRALDRPEWGAALFLLCATQNISLDFSYFYFTDVPFMALGTLALAWQLEAWRRGTWRASVLSGLGAGLMFWVKAPNAVLFAGTYFLAEIIRFFLLDFQTRKPSQGTAAAPGSWLLHGSGILAGFLPATFLALACGGLQSIVQLIDANEVSGLFVTHLESTGLMRFLYFPLCLAFFYHAMVMILIVAAVGFAAFQGRVAVAKTPLSTNKFPALLLLPLVSSYFIFGEIFSFGMANKEMRSLLLVLPVLWLSIFWLAERLKVRPGLFFLGAVAYLLCGFSQLFFNAFESAEISTESFQLKGDWLSRFPQPLPTSSTGAEMTANLLEVIRGALPEGGKVAVGTEQLFLTSESLTWSGQHGLALQGKTSPYEFENFLTNEGKFSRSALLQSRGILVFVHPGLQYSRQVQEASVAIIRFAAGPWTKNETVRVVPLRASNSELLGCLLIAKEPLSDAQITELISSTGATELPREIQFNAPPEEHLSLRDAWHILKRWEQKRL